MFAAALTASWQGGGQRGSDAAPRKGRKWRRLRFLPLQMALLLFGSGFLLGRAPAAQIAAGEDAGLPALSSDGSTGEAPPLFRQQFRGQVRAPAGRLRRIGNGSW